MYYLRFAIIGLLLFSSVSCITTGEPDYEELTPEEYQRLLAKVRSFVKVSPQLNLNPLSPLDKAFVQNNEPKFTAYYTGDKRGSFRMIWARKRPQTGWSTIKDFTECNITIRGKGEFLKDNCKIRMSVSKFAR